MNDRSHASSTAREFCRFLVVGGAGTVLNLFVFVLLHRLSGLHYEVAAVLSFLCAVTSNYHWNQKWTFRRTGRPQTHVQYGEFFVTSIFGLVVNLVVLALMTNRFGCPPELGQLAGIAAGTVFNFAGSKFWVFSQRRTANGNEVARHTVFLIVLLVAAGVLRVHMLEKESLWIDEAFSVRFSSQDIGRVWASEPTNPPLYFVFLHFWMKVFGTGESAVRMLSVIPSVLAVVLTYILGVRLWNEKVGLVGAGYMAVSSFHVYYAQEARCFAWLLAFLLGSLLALDLALKSENSRIRVWSWFAYFAATLAALYTHFYALFFVGAENLFFFLRWRENRKRLALWLGIQIALAAVFLPWLLASVLAAGGHGQVRRHLWLKLPQAFFSFLAGDTLIPLDEAAVKDIPGTLLANLHYVGAALVGYAVLCVTAVVAAKHACRSALFAGVIIFGPTATAFAVSFRMPIFEERYLIGVTPMLYLFLASGVVAEATPYRRRKPLTRWLATGAGATALLLAAISLYNYYFHPRFGREQWRETVGFVERNAQAGDLVVLHPGFISVSYDYYARRKDLAVCALRDAVDSPVTTDAWRGAQEEMLNHHRLWLVESHAPSDKVAQWCRGAFLEIRERRFPKAKGITVRLFERQK